MIDVINLSEYRSPIVDENSSREDWVDYGEDNCFYDYIIEGYNTSSTNSAIINNIAKLVYGRGLSALNGKKRPNEYAQMMALFNQNEVKKVIFDRKLFGQFAFQVHYDKKRNVKKVYHIPVNLLRAEKCNKDGDIVGYYYSDNWEDVKKYKPKRFDAFGYGKGDVEIYRSEPYAPNMKYYANPDYIASLPYCVLEKEISDYLINEVQNGFSMTKVVNFNNGMPDEEKREAIKNDILRKLTGSRGAKVVVSFNDNVENKTTVDDIPLNDAPEHYQYLSEECMRKIMLAHNVTSPLLFGIASTNGFSSNADELKNSAILFDNMVIKPIQDEILQAIDDILAVNGIALNLYFKTLQPLEFTDLENAQTEEQIAEETGLEMSEQLPEWLDKYGEAQNENWVLIDEFDAVDLEDETDALNEYKLSTWELVKTGISKAIAPSEQDKIVNDVKFMTRYRYTGKLKENTRAFCKAMLQANKLYRKEDIMAMSNEYLGDGYTNKDGKTIGWGANGELTFDRFKYKGGGDCHHVWRREVYATLNTDAKSPLSKDARKIMTSIAEKRGYKVRNPYQVNVQPTNLPYNGFLPTNKRFK